MVLHIKSLSRRSVATPVRVKQEHGVMTLNTTKEVGKGGVRTNQVYSGLKLGLLRTRKNSDSGSSYELLIQSP